MTPPYTKRRARLRRFWDAFLAALESGKPIREATWERAILRAAAWST